MSQETLEWLNVKTLIGNTLQRGNAWHKRAVLQGTEPNHYEGFIPVEDVVRRLFGWEAVEGDFKSTGSILTAEGVETFTIEDKDRKVILRPPGALGPDDKGAVLGVFMQGYERHSYRTWLLDQVAAILDDDLGISSAGLLKMGAVAWVEVSIPDTITTPSGVPFRPNLLAGTSFDGSIATFYKRTAKNTVCDNTMAIAMRSEGGVFRVKHTRNSSFKLVDVRNAVEIIHSAADDFMAQVEQLTNTTVSDGDWQQFLDTLIPVPEDDGRSRTIATNKHAELQRLWNHDNRVAPWKDTAWGVVQAVNTFEHHFATVRGASRPERNLMRDVTGEWDRIDAGTLETLQAVMA